MARETERRRRRIARRYASPHCTARARRQRESTVLSGVLLATLPESGVAQGSAAECVQETDGEYSKHRQCWDGGKRQGRWVVRLPGGEVREGAYVAGKKQGRWVVRLPDGGVQEGPYVAGEKQGHWVLHHADGTVEEGAVVGGLREGRWMAHRPDGSRRTFEMAGGRLVEGSVRVAARAQGSREAAALPASSPAAETAARRFAPHALALRTDGLAGEGAAAEVLAAMPGAEAAGAAVDAQAPDGATALFMAVVLGHTEVVGLLMEAEADPTVKGPKGKTAVDVASTVGNPAILKALGVHAAVAALSPKCAELPGSYPDESGDNHAFAQCWQELADNPGCYAYRSRYRSGDSVRGTGACRGGRLERGTVTLEGDRGGVAEGPVVDGKANGHWVLRSASGDVWEGPYVDGERNGHWVLRSANGGVWEGPVVDGKQHGRWVGRANGGCSMIEYSRGVEVGDRASC